MGIVIIADFDIEGYSPYQIVAGLAA